MVVMKNAITVEELIKKYPDVNEFLIKKWERIFTMFFDRNNSHAVDWGDFYLVVRKVRDIYGAESVQTGYAKSSLQALWEGLVQLADQDKDQLISIDEWVGLLRKTDPKKEPKWFNDYMHFMFKLFDVSGDGVMDLAEYTDGMSTYGFQESECHKAFHKFAITPRFHEPMKAISPEMWKQYFHDFFYSTDRAALGNHLFGVIEF